jgi:hypothetical protein
MPSSVQLKVSDTTVECSCDRIRRPMNPTSSPELPADLPCCNAEWTLGEETLDLGTYLHMHTDAHV